MSRLRAWGMAAALAAGAVAPATAADSPSATTDSRPFYKRMFSAPKPAPVGPVVRKGPVVAPPGQPPLSQPLPPAMLAEVLKAEQDAYLRRMDVCVKLQQAAIELNDETLMQQAQEIQRQAEALYKQRMAALGLSKTVRSPLPSSGNPVASSLDLAPEKPTDPKAAAAKLVAPASPVPVSGATTASSSTETDVREVKP